ncbi:MAG: WecB/TagA/CpsF family glycosyltransferase [Candidatus Omnitrophica bacterium]|nr:WecB/TagA/CpsF family glycosyltransferase [Candidatus Omnitrophota bacterium]
MISHSYEKQEILGVPVHKVGTAEIHNYISQVIDHQEKALVLNVNVNAMNLAIQRSWMSDLFRKAPLVFCDGDGVRWALKWKGYGPPPKVTYARWIWELADWCAGKNYSFYFLGGKPGIAEKARDALREKIPNLQVRGYRDGYFEKEGKENEAVIEEINRLKPDILILGFGMPLQEEWLNQYWEKLDARIFLTGGAVFDYTSGVLKRAPEWMIRMQMEWLYRLLQDPVRLFQRYVFGNPYFFYQVFLEKIGRR